MTTSEVDPGGLVRDEGMISTVLVPELTSANLNFACVQIALTVDFDSDIASVERPRIEKAVPALGGSINPDVFAGERPRLDGVEDELSTRNTVDTRGIHTRGVTPSDHLKVLKRVDVTAAVDGPDGFASGEIARRQYLRAIPTRTRNVELECLYVEIAVEAVVPRPEVEVELLAEVVVDVWLERRGCLVVWGPFQRFVRVAVDDEEIVTVASNDEVGVLAVLGDLCTVYIARIGSMGVSGGLDRTLWKVLGGLTIARRPYPTEGKIRNAEVKLQLRGPISPFQPTKGRTDRCSNPLGNLFAIENSFGHILAIERQDRFSYPLFSGAIDILNPLSGLEQNSYLHRRSVKVDQAYNCTSLTSPFVWL